jgi:hypothetical protein
MADINYPINPERRDPFYSKSKGDIGLSKVPNMSFWNLKIRCPSSYVRYSILINTSI